MSDLNNSINQPTARSVRAVFFFAIFLIILGFSNIIFGNYRVQFYNDVYRKLEALDKETIGNQNLDDIKQEDPDISTDILPTVMNKIGDEKRESRIRAKAKLEFYKFVELGGKCFLVISAILILYCLYYSKVLEKKPVLMLFITLASFSF